MTDREKLLSICESLGLERRDKPPAEYYMEGERCYFADDTRVILGSGAGGYNGFYVEFKFNPDGSAKEHAVLE